MLASLRKREEAWDIVIIGGGATGMGIAVDAASRGYAVCLLERSDFGQGTSVVRPSLSMAGVSIYNKGNIL